MHSVDVRFITTLRVPRTAGRVGFLANGALVLVQRRQGVDFHPEDILFDVVWERLHLIRRMYVCRHAEHCFAKRGQRIICESLHAALTLIELFER